MYAIVRPFQREVPQSTRRIIASNTKIDVEPAIISWGRAGTIAGAQEIEQIDETGTSFSVITCDDRYQEDTRKEQQYKVEQTDNPENFVILKRLKEVTFTKISESLFNSEMYNKTTDFKTAIETAEFSTVNFNNKKCQSNYELKVEIPA